jgi:hypothetical protein
MNIFYLDHDPDAAAYFHNDKHVVKMIVESCQLLSTVFPEDKAPYKRTHYNHPCAKWVRESLENWTWLAAMTYALLDEWRERYKHNHVSDHKCYGPLSWMDQHIHEFTDINFRHGKTFTEPPQCMPEDCKGEDTVEAYRKLYMTHKRGMAQWRQPACKPDWFK